MRVLAFSDLHLDSSAADAILAAADRADLIIGAGDFAQRREGLRDFMARLDPIAPRAIYVPGNAETDAELRAATSATVLHGQSVTQGGLTIAGIGGAIPPLPVTLPWGSFDIAEDTATGMLDAIPACDILVSHSPPHGVADRHTQLGHLGSPAIRAAAVRLRPRLLLCGHIHDCWGETGQIGATQVANLGPHPIWFDL